MDRDVDVEQSTQHVDLFEHSVDEFGAVAGTDERAFRAGPADAAFDLEVRTAAVLLGILLGKPEDQAAEFRGLGPEAFSRLALRRSNSRRADGPAVPDSAVFMTAGSTVPATLGSIGVLTSWLMQRSDFVAPS